MCAHDRERQYLSILISTSTYCAQNNHNNKLKNLPSWLLAQARVKCAHRRSEHVHHEARTFLIFFFKQAP